MLSSLHSNIVVKKLFHTLDNCLQDELKDCRTVLDLGCGPSSPIQQCKNIKYSVGVEAFKPYLAASKKKKIHTKYLQKKIGTLNFKENSFDAVIMIEVLEHLPKSTALSTLKKAEKWAKRKIIISTPNGYLHQHALDDNVLQKHLSGWDYKLMQKLGYRCNGLAGLKWLRTENEDHSMDGNLLNSIKFRPKLFWFVIASLSQIMIYYFPSLAFEIFCVKNLKKKV